MTELLSRTKTINVNGLRFTVTYSLEGGVFKDDITDQMPAHVSEAIENSVLETIHTDIHTYLTELVKAAK